MLGVGGRGRRGGGGSLVRPPGKCNCPLAGARGFGVGQVSWLSECAQTVGPFLLPVRGVRKRRRDTEGSGRLESARKGRTGACVPEDSDSGRMLRRSRPQAPTLGAASRSRAATPGRLGRGEEGWGAAALGSIVKRNWENQKMFTAKRGLFRGVGGRWYGKLHRQEHWLWVLQRSSCVGNQAVSGDENVGRGRVGLKEISAEKAARGWKCHQGGAMAPNK